MRVLSHSEISTALTCPARWDFRYSDRLAGSSLRPKRIAPMLSEGRAWGAAAAAYHVSGDGQDAIDAMDTSLDADAEHQREAGVHVQEDHDAVRLRLLAMLTHYIAETDPMGIDPILERELEVPIPSRTGRRSSSRYHFLCRLDGTRQIEGRPWLIEFKLRRNLMSVTQIALDRQCRWYAWTYWKATGIKVAGVEVHERWNEVPRQPRLVKTGRKDGSVRPSHARDQLCTPQAYRAVCEEYGEEFNPETQEELERRRWHQAVPIIFRDGELEEAGRELVAAAQMVGQLDRGEILPLRNPSRANCGACAFIELCPSPDSGLVEALYERVPPKRDRVLEEAIA